MSKTPLVKTSGRARARARWANWAGSQILASKEIMEKMVSEKSYQVQLLVKSCTWYDFSDFPLIRDGGHHPVASRLLGDIEGAVRLVQDLHPILGVGRHGGHARGNRERADRLFGDKEAPLLPPRGGRARG